MKILLIGDRNAGKNTQFLSQEKIWRNMGRFEFRCVVFALLTASAQYWYQFTHKWIFPSQTISSGMLFSMNVIILAIFGTTSIPNRFRSWKGTAQYKQQHWNIKSPSKPTARSSAHMSISTKIRTAMNDKNERTTMTHSNRFRSRYLNVDIFSWQKKKTYFTYIHNMRLCHFSLFLQRKIHFKANA